MFCTTSDYVAECLAGDREIADSNFGRGYTAPGSTQPSIPPGVG